MELDPKDLEDMGISESEYVSDTVSKQYAWLGRACAIAITLYAVFFV